MEALPPGNSLFLQQFNVEQRNQKCYVLKEIHWRNFVKEGKLTLINEAN
jgi:hypothetical protein